MATSNQQTAEAEAPPRSAAASAERRILSPADLRSFSKLAADLPGREGIAVTALDDGSRVQRFGSLRTGVAWSTAKVFVAMAAIDAGVAREQDLVQAISVSDNAAAERLWVALGGGERSANAATAQLRRAGDSRTRVQSKRLRAGYTAFGQTAWALTDQARFVARMACTRAGSRVLGLMGNVVGGQRWGLGRVRRSARFKGGWGPGTTPGADDGWLDRQMGIVRIGGRPLAVAIASGAPDHAAATRALTAIARWVSSHADTRGAPSRSHC